MADKGVSMGRLLISSRAIGGVQRFPLTNFSSTDQFIPAGMVVGKILLVDQVVEDIRAVDPVSPKGEESLPFMSRINPDLTKEEKGNAVALLDRYSGCFAKTPNELGRSNLVKHKIDTGEHLPLHQPPYASAWRERDLIEEQTRTMLKNKVAVYSNSPWASPVVLVRKKDGEWRFCVDYRRLNSITSKDVYPLPRIDDALSRLEGSRYFSILDMQAGYWQVEVDEQDRAKTAFITADGLYEFKVRANKCAGHFSADDGCGSSRAEMEHLSRLSRRYRRLCANRLPTSRASRNCAPAHRQSGSKAEALEVLFPRVIA
jgi:hypothetical protein